MLPLVMAALTMILLLGFAAPASAAVHFVSVPAEFGDALDAYENDDIIRLMQNIYFDMNDGNIMIDKVVTFDVNGFILEVTGSDDYYLLKVDGESGGKLILDDSAGGAFNVIDLGSCGTSVLVTNGSEATVTNIIQKSSNNWTIQVLGGSILNVTGNVKCHNNGVKAVDGSAVTIDGTLWVDESLFTYISVGSTDMSKDEGVYDTSAGYIVYTDDVNTVCLRAICEIDTTPVTWYNDLADALSDVLDDETIKLLTNINYNTGILISDKSFTFDVNGFVLNVMCEDSEVTDGGALEVSDGQV